MKGFQRMAVFRLRSFYDLNTLLGNLSSYEVYLRFLEGIKEIKKNKDGKNWIQELLSSWDTSKRSLLAKAFFSFPAFFVSINQNYFVVFLFHIKEKPLFSKFSQRET